MLQPEGNTTNPTPNDIWEISIVSLFSYTCNPIMCCIELEVIQYEDHVLFADPTQLEAGREHLRNKRAR